MSEQELIIRARAALDVLATVEPVSGEIMQALLEENERTRIELEQARQLIEQLRTDLARRDSGGLSAAIRTRCMPAGCSALSVAARESTECYSPGWGV